MIDDGMFKRFPKPDVVLGQHVMSCRPGTSIGVRALSLLRLIACRFACSGAVRTARCPSQHRPRGMAASTVMRLQTIVSREVSPADSAVVTIGVLQAGTKENVIPDEALIKLNVRTFDEGVRKRVLAAIERIAKAEAAASGAPRPPEITHWISIRQ